MSRSEARPSRRRGRKLVYAALGSLLVLAELVVLGVLLLDRDVAPIRSLGHVTGRWVLIDDRSGLLPDIDARPDWLSLVAASEGPEGRRARLAWAGGECLVDCEPMIVRHVAGSGSWPFAGAGNDGEVHVLVHELDAFPSLDRLSLDLALDGVRPLSRGTRRLTYERD